MPHPIKERYSWSRFLAAFKYIDTYQAFIDSSKEPKLKPAVILTFKSKIHAKIFLYWMMKLGGVNLYESVVYMNDVVPEVYEDVVK